MGCGCGDCEAMMQPYIDGMLSDDEVAEAKEHLERCPPVRHGATASRSSSATSSGRRRTSRCPPGLREKLESLRTSPPAA